jgi:hypothetical protein
VTRGFRDIQSVWNILRQVVVTLVIPVIVSNHTGIPKES